MSVLSYVQLEAAIVMSSLLRFIFARVYSFRSCVMKISDYSMYQTPIIYQSLALVNKLVPCSRLSSGALEVCRLRLRFRSHWFNKLTCFLYVKLVLCGTCLWYLLVQLLHPYTHKPPFKYATVPYGSTETNLINNFPEMYEYMRVYNKSTAIEGVRAVKEGYTSYTSS